MFFEPPVTATSCSNMISPSDGATQPIGAPAFLSRMAAGMSRMPTSTSPWTRSFSMSPEKSVCLKGFSSAIFLYAASMSLSPPVHSFDVRHTNICPAELTML